MLNEGMLNYKLNSLEKLLTKMAKNTLITQPLLPEGEEE